MAASSPLRSAHPFAQRLHGDRGYRLGGASYGRSAGPVVAVCASGPVLGLSVQRWHGVERLFRPGAGQAGEVVPATAVGARESERRRGPRDRTDLPRRRLRGTRGFGANPRRRLALLVAGGRPGGGDLPL